MENKQRKVAIQLSGVKKRYKLGQIGGGTLTADLQSWWARVRGKEDPNIPVNVDQRLIGQTFMALNGIDLTVYQGEALGIIGSNGAGKSTMLKLLCRVTAPTEGEIDIHGRIASMLEVGTGFNGEMTGRENIYMNGAILGMTKAEIDAKMEDIIEFSEVRDFIDTPVKRYSSGMFVKLAFSVAAHLDSEIMIMDEVLAVGDMAFQKKCLDKMRAAATAEGRTVLYVSHNMNTIRRLCDRCIVLDKGRVIFEGDVEDAISIYSQGLYGTQKDGQIEFDLRQTDSRLKYTSGQVVLPYMKLLDKETAEYETGEPIRFKMRVEPKINCADLRLRMEFKYRDETPVATMPFVSLGPCQAGQPQEYQVQVTLPGLTCGKYRAVIVLYEMDEFGNSFDHETLAPAFVFEIKGREELVWNPSYWGHISLPQADIKKLDTGSNGILV